jgi:ribosome biogenesis protein YTM1
VFDRAQALLHTAPLHAAPVTSFTIVPSLPVSSDEDLLVVTASHDRTAQISRVLLDGTQATTSTPLATLHLHDSPIADVASTRDGKHILTAGWDGLIGLWSTSIPETDEVPLDAVAGPERKKRRKVQDGDSVKTKAPSMVLRSHTARVSAVKSSEGGDAVSCGFDSTIRTWDIERGLCAHTIVRTFICFSRTSPGCADSRLRYRQSPRNRFSPSPYRRPLRLPSRPLRTVA